MKRYIIRIKQTEIDVNDKIAAVMLVVAMLMPYLPRQIRRPYQVIKMLFLCILFLWGIQGNKKNINSLFPVMIYAAALPASAWYNRIPVSTLFVTISDALLFCDMYLVITKLVRRYAIGELAVLLMRIVFVYLLFTDISAFLIEPGKEKIYFIGTKFRVSYLHWFAFILLLLQEYSGLLGSKLFIPLFMVWSLIVILHVDCITGAVGLCAIMGISLLYRRFNLRRIFCPRFLTVYIFISLIVFWSINTVLNIEIVKFFITQILGRDVALSGRLRIYESLNEVVYGSLYFGYGYQNRAVSSIVGYGNAQNGIYEIAVNYGLFGLLGFFAAVWSSCKRMKELTDEIAPFSFLLLGLTFVSIIEVSYNNYYFLALAFAYAYMKEDAVRSEIVEWG